MWRQRTAGGRRRGTDAETVSVEEQPTRVIRGRSGPPQRGEEPDQRQLGQLRLTIACLGAVIVGLLIALLAGAGSGGETTTVTETVQEQIGEPTATTPTGTTEDEQTGDTTDSGGISPEVEEDTGTTEEVVPDTGGEVLPEPDLGEDTTEPSGGISPDG